MPPAGRDHQRAPKHAMYAPITELGAVLQTVSEDPQQVSNWCQAMR